MTHKVLIVDRIDDILMKATFRADHFDTMVCRGWIKFNSWIVEGEIVYVMKHEHLVEYLKEVAL